MDFNPFLNKLITERNSAVVEDPLVDLLAEMVKAIVRLEAQQETPASVEQPAPTESATRAENSAAASVHELVRSVTEGTILRTSPLQLLLGVLPREDRTHAERCSECRDLLDAFSLNLWMHVPAAELLTSTSRKQATSPSAATPSDDATSPSGSSSSYDMRPFLEADGYPLSPASYPEPAQGGSEAICAATGNERCLVAIGGGVPCADYIRCAALTPRTMKEGSERG